MPKTLTLFGSTGSIYYKANAPEADLVPELLS